MRAMLARWQLMLHLTDVAMPRRMKEREGTDGLNILKKVRNIMINIVSLQSYIRVTFRKSRGIPEHMGSEWRLGIHFSPQIPIKSPLC